MTWTTNVLVLARVTASSDELLTALSDLAQRGPTEFTLVVPANAGSGGRQTAEKVMQAAVQRLRDAGLKVEGTLGDCDPCVAATESYDPRQHDEILVSTLPLGASKWLHAGLPERIAKLTGAKVRHVVSYPRPKVPETQPAPPRPEPLGLLSPLLAPYGALPHADPPVPPLR